MKRCLCTASANSLILTVIIIGTSTTATCYSSYEKPIGLTLVTGNVARDSVKDGGTKNVLILIGSPNHLLDVKG